ncbi:MAG: response regulator [Anaerolineaceae bacterium]|nr:response regulator [Anaerolineaceae bacterium]
MTMEILLIAKDNALRNGFQTLLTALSTDGEVDVLADLSKLPSQFQKKSYQFVYIYPGLPFEELLEAMRTIKQEHPQVKVVMVVEDQNQGFSARQAGADRVILKGFSSADLMYLIQALRTEQSDSPARVTL